MAQVKEAFPRQERVWHIFLIFLRLGLTAFGGPVAHLGYFRDEFVTRRRWLTERSYVDLVALCQFLPGPASSQVGMALGLSRGGYLGALAAWAGFTLPSAVVLIVLAMGLSSHGYVVVPGVLHGLKVVVVAVVAQAVWSMARNLCPDAVRASMMIVTACFVLLVPSVWGQMAVLVLAGLAGLWLFMPTDIGVHDPLPVRISHRAGVFWLSCFFVLLIVLPALALPGRLMAEFNVFYRAGSLVFGGGHVVLPLLQTAVVPSGWVSNEIFLAGYGITQAMPGPLFTFAAFLGASMRQSPSGWLGGLVCLLAIFLPSFLLVTGALPLWAGLRHNRRIQAALMGVNAAVVGLLLAALYQPVWVNAIGQTRDFALALLALLALVVWKLPPWLVVLGSGGAGWLLSRIMI